MPLRVLYLIDTLEVGGAERSLLDILSRTEGVAATVCHLYPGASLRSDYEAAGIRVIGLDLPGRYGFRAALSRLLPLVRQGDFDLICGLLARAGVVARVLGRLTGTPVIGHFVNDSYGPLRLSTLPAPARLKLRLWQGLDRLTAPWNQHFVANSRAIADGNRRALGLARDRVSVIYRARDAGVFAPSAPGGRAREGGPVLLNVGRLVSQKSQHILLEALLPLRASLPGLRLRIVGDGPLEGTLRARVRALGLDDAVEFLGNRDDVPELLRAADVFVFPSRYEGHPGALVEAMLAGLPVIASDIPVHRETIADGHTGLLVPVDDAAAWADAIRRLADSPHQRAALGRAAREVALRRFDIRQIARQHESLYRRLRAAPRPVRRRALDDADVTRMVAHGEVDWVLVDYFGTLVHRDADPRGVKALAARRLVEHLGLALDPERILGSRLQAERRARARSLALHGDDEHRLEDVAAELLHEIRRLGTAGAPADDAALREALIEAELAAEMEVQRPRDEVIDRLRSWARLGVRMALVSDFYLAEPQMRRLLRHHRVEDLFAEVFVSCDAGLNKNSGQLYDHVLDRLGVAAQRVVMVGDNAHSDIAMARSRDCHALYVGEERRGARAGLRRAPSAEAAIERVLHAHRAAAFPEMALTLWEFTRRLDARLREDGATGALFLAREGQFLKRLFDQYQASCARGAPIPSRYLYASRKAVYLPSRTGVDREGFELLLQHPDGCTPQSFLGSLGLPAGLPLQAPLSAETLRRSPEFRAAYEERRQEQRRLLLRYLGQLAGPDAPAHLHLVDAGWKGTMQDCLADLFGDTVGLTGYYVGVCSDRPLAHENAKHGLIFEKKAARSPFYGVFRSFKLLYEVLLTADHPSVAGYAERAGEVVPVFDEQAPESECYASLIAPLQQRLFGIFRELCALGEPASRTADVPARFLASRHARMVHFPRESELEFAERIVHYENFGAMTLRGLRTHESPGSRLGELARLIRSPRRLVSGPGWAPLRLRNRGLAPAIPVVGAFRYYRDVLAHDAR
jgi:HAD superfamily hydrolase (TIGR01549 family)